MQVHSIDEPRDERRFLFSKRIRRLLLYSGLFVLYSQLVSAGLTSVYRYGSWDPTWMDGGHPAIFGLCTLTLLQPPEGIGTIENWRAVGWSLEFSPARYIAWAVIAPIIGSAPPFLATFAGTGWGPRCLLLVASCLGIAAACAIKLHEWMRGALGWTMLAQTIADGTLPHAPHLIYGYAGLIGSFLMPILVYPSIILFIVITSAWSVLRFWPVLSRRRQGRQRR